MRYDRDAAIREQLTGGSSYLVSGIAPRREIDVQLTDWGADTHELPPGEDRYALEEAFRRARFRPPTRYETFYIALFDDRAPSPAETRRTPPAPRARALSEVSVNRDSTEDIRLALRVAQDRGDATLPGWLIGALSGEIRDNSTRELLIDFSEVVVWPSELYAQGVAALLKQAMVLRDTRPADYDRPLAVALRTIAGVAPLEEASELIAFLRADDPPRTKHAALAAIRILFSAEPPAAEQPVLWARLTELLEKYFDPEFISSIEVRALALSTFISAAASGLPRLIEFASVATTRLTPLMRWQLVDDLRDLRENWLAGAPAMAGSRPAELVLDAITRLGS